MMFEVGRYHAIKWQTSLQIPDFSTTTRVPSFCAHRFGVCKFCWPSCNPPVLIMTDGSGSYATRWNYHETSGFCDPLVSHSQCVVVPDALARAGMPVTDWKQEHNILNEFILEQETCPAASKGRKILEREACLDISFSCNLYVLYCSERLSGDGVINRYCVLATPTCFLSLSSSV